MAIQAKGADPRLYNPDRDMLWAMPRLMRRALLQFGEGIDNADVRDFLRAHDMNSDYRDETIQSTLEAVITDLARFLVDLKDNVEVRHNAKERFEAIFGYDTQPKLYSALRALIGNFFISVIFAELPIWFDSVQPEKANNPAPTVEEVLKTVGDMLGTCGRDGASSPKAEDNE
jgi:hypothetical protein